MPSDTKSETSTKYPRNKIQTPNKKQ